MYTAKLGTLILILMLALAAPAHALGFNAEGCINADVNVLRARACVSLDGTHFDAGPYLALTPPVSIAEAEQLAEGITVNAAANGSGLLGLRFDLTREEILGAALFAEASMDVRFDVIVDRDDEGEGVSVAVEGGFNGELSAFGRVVVDNAGPRLEIGVRGGIAF